MIHTRGDDIFSNLVYYSPSRSGLRLSYVTRILPESTSSDSLAVLLATAGRPFICMRKQALFFFFKKKKGAGFGRPSGYYLIPSASPFRIRFGECASPARHYSARE